MRWLVQENAKEWLFDLSDVLLFPHLPIHNVQYSIEIESEDAFARHASRPPQGMVRPLVLSLLLLSLVLVRPLGVQVVRVVTDVAVTATVTITVDQSQHSEEFWQNKTCPCPWAADCRCF